MIKVRNKTLIRIFAILALAVFLGFTILTSLPMGANAISSQEAQRKKDAAKAQQNKELEKRRKIDAQISEIQKEIDVFQAQINEKVAKINESEEKINQLTVDLQNQNAAYNERAKSMIKRGNVSYLEIVLRSKSTQDLLTRVSVLKHVAKYDTKKLQEIRDSMTEVEELKEKLLEEKAEVVALKEEQDAKKAVLDGYRAESQAIIDKLQKDINSYEAQYKAAKKAEEAARAAAYRAQTSGSYSVPSNFVGGQFAWPSNTTLVTSPYGYRVHPVLGNQRFHSGVDIGAPYGSSIFAANSGTVIVSGYNSGGYGNYVVISHGGGYSTLYAHCSSLLVSAGQQVSKGQVIAKCGSTGMSTGPHIHFEIQLNGKTTNPMSYYR
jgi:murein DD-endopeptidase MepM/ murein hydrolase activator NlpD